MPTSDGGTEQLTEVRYVFTLPEGVEANAKFMIEQLDINEDFVSFEIFNSRGERKIIETLEDAGQLKGKALTNWLYPDR